MPIFEYQCKGCCHQFEQIMSSSEASNPDCPECNCADVVKLISAGSFRPNGIPTGSGGFTPPPCKPSG